MNLAQQAKIELAKRELARRHLLEAVKYHFPGYDTNWHHEVIAEKLELIAAGELKRLIITMPPRHGKSELASIHFPAWYIGKYPDKEIIAASYSSDLSGDFGRKVRNMFQDDEKWQNIFPDVQLAQDSKSASKWNIKGKKGAYLAVGIGGAATGKGADCVVAGTIIQTENGEKPIETLHDWERVLSFNHDTNKPEFKRIVANQRKTNKSIATITTSCGHKVTGTMDHEIFVIGRGYVKIQDIQTGERVKIYSGHKNTNHKMRSLWQRIRERMVRVYQTNTQRLQGFLLFRGLFKDTSFIQKFISLFNLQQGDWEARQEILFERMQTKNQKKIARYSLRVVQNIISTINKIYEILFNGLQKQVSFQVYSGQSKSELQTWDGGKYIYSRVLQNTQKNYQERWGRVYGMRVAEENLCTSSGFKSEKQCSRESCNCLHNLPYDSSPLIEDTVSSITTEGVGDIVYDIQVEDNHNFFANNILVHNCLIIDDPFKNRQEAESPIIRQTVWDWYTSTARTRLSPDGAVICILTRWHDSDLVGMLQMQEQEQSRHQWEVINFPAIAEKDEEIRYHKLTFGLDGKLQRQPISFFRKAGTALWPTRFSLENLLETKKDISPYDWSSLYQQNPVDAESAVFEKGWFQDIEEEKVKEKMTRRFLTIDTAGPMTSQSNYTGVVDNRVDSDGFWNIKAKRYQISPAALVDLIFALDEKNQYEKIGIEKTIFLSALQPFIESEAIRRGKESRFSGDSSIITELKHNQTAKEIRIRGLIPFYKNGIIKHIKGECENLVPQLRRFPKGSDDDLIDALAYQTQIAEAPYGWNKEDLLHQERAEKDFDPHNPLSEI